MKLHHLYQKVRALHASKSLELFNFFVEHIHPLKISKAHVLYEDFNLLNHNANLGMDSYLCTNDYYDLHGTLLPLNITDDLLSKFKERTERNLNIKGLYEIDANVRDYVIGFNNCPTVASVWSCCGHGQLKKAYITLVSTDMHRLIDLLADLPTDIDWMVKPLLSEGIRDFELPNTAYFVASLSAKRYTLEGVQKLVDALQ